MYHQSNPFLQHAVRHGKMILSESNRAAGAAQSMITACDEIMRALNSGNIQGAFNAAQNARNLAGQVAQTTQRLNDTINERMQMAAFIINRLQYRINELANAFQSFQVDQYSTGFQQEYPQMATGQQNMPPVM